jgi:hypothetical protein
VNSPRSRSVALVLAVLTAVAAVLIGATPAGAADHCSVSWGSLPKVHDTRADTETLNGVRAGRHACFDRLVIDVGGQDVSFGSYDVRYVPQVYTDGKGDAVPVRGAADLQIIVRAPAYDQQGNPTFVPSNPSEVVNVAGYSTFRQVAWAGTFEGQTTLALGVRARLPFRVFTLNGVANSGETPRMVIDVAHRW